MSDRLARHWPYPESTVFLLVMGAATVCSRAFG